MNSINPELLLSPEYPVQPELLVSAVLHLMSHYTVNSAQNEDAGSCLKLASVIERHLKILADLPNLAPVLRATCQQLSEHWADLVERKLPQQNKLSLLLRLVAGRKQ
ncbi:MAG: hypothetical protein Q7U12_13435 [Undibacterium sp.]|jgi:hypothetical protein|nr:hypothetical protein [Undibacterium sp.]MDO8702962.1 hypothetical protein [Undibacterium sp.]MDO9193896.1 hypothetical protein [Undibacterium sp.]